MQNPKRERLCRVPRQNHKPCQHRSQLIEKRLPIHRFMPRFNIPNPQRIYPPKSVSVSELRTPNFELLIVFHTPNCSNLTWTKAVQVKIFLEVRSPSVFVRVSPCQSIESRRDDPKIAQGEGA